MDLLNYADSESEPESSNEPAIAAAVLGKRTRPSSTEDAERETKPNGSSNLDARKKSNVEDKVIKKPKKSLPKLNSTFQTAPIDDPTLHQGRTRARPWVQGDYPAHVYLELRLGKGLKNLLKEVITQAQAWIDEEAGSGKFLIHSIFEDGTDNISTPISEGGSQSLAQPEDLDLGIEAKEKKVIPPEPTPRPSPSNLHISLTHPLPLRTFQISLLLTHLRSQLGRAGQVNADTSSGSRGVARTEAGVSGLLKVGLEGGFRAYTNGTQTDKSRAGFEAGKASSLRNDDKEGRNDESGAGSESGRHGTGSKSRGFLALGVGVGHEQLQRIQDRVIHPFLKTHHLPLYHLDPEFHTSFAWSLLSPDARKDSPFHPSLVSRLEEKFGEEVRSLCRDGWDVSEVRVRVGKVVHRFEL